MSCEPKLTPSRKFLLNDFPKTGVVINTWEFPEASEGQGNVGVEISIHEIK